MLGVITAGLITGAGIVYLLSIYSTVDERTIGFIGIVSFYACLLFYVINSSSEKDQDLEHAGQHRPDLTDVSSRNADS